MLYPTIHSEYSIFKGNVKAVIQKKQNLSPIEMKTQNSPTDPIGPVGPTKTSAKKHTGCFSSVQTSYLFSGFCKLGL